jgi:hypothetical protein
MSLNNVYDVTNGFNYLRPRDLFAKSIGIVVMIGDLSHPTGIKIVACYPDWAERNEMVLEATRNNLPIDIIEKDDF